jgi:asparagine synthase (glutamine-hydrolysing)
MCGIAGVFGRGDAATVARMAKTLAHRGPDDELVVGGQHFALASRRLSIVDVDGGRQPVGNETASVWAANNGEIYNFARVRDELLAAGHALHTRCDSEVLPHLWEEHGERMVERIDGMFAIAVWDDERRAGLLARDRMGKKPLYYLETADALFFASEIKALLRVPRFERRMSLEALHHYLSYKHVPHPLTIFDRIRAVPPGQALLYEHGSTHLFRYWRADFSAELEIGEDEAVDRLLELLRDAVARRLMGDVPIGFFLSGGIDSSLSTALAAEASSGPIKTFTLTYGRGSTTAGKEEDRRWARYVAERFATEHHEDSVEFQTFPDAIKPILRSFDEPFAGVVSTYFLSELIARNVKVAVSGDGADELFGSYRSHRLALPLAAWARGDDTDLGEFDAAELEQLAEPDDWAWRAKLLVFSEDEKRALYVPEIDAALAFVDTRDELRQTYEALTARDPLNRVLEAEFNTFLPDQVLTFVDRLSMAHSLEVRAPYLDTAVVEFIASLPGRLKIKDGETKYVLKKAAGRYFPAEMTHRAKEGFVMPVTDWLLDLEEYVRDTLSGTALRRHGVFAPSAVAELVDGYYAERGDWRYGNKILALVVFQEWCDLYLGGSRV